MGIRHTEESAPCSACLRAKKTLCSSSLLIHTSVPHGSPAPQVLLDLLTGLRLIEEESVRQNTLLGVSQYIQFMRAGFLVTQMQSRFVLLESQT